MIEKFGLLNLSGNLVDELKKTALCSQGEFRIHSFGYDWRDDLAKSSERLNAFVSNIAATYNTQPDSMGGLVSLSAINKQPHLYKSAIFVGTPFHSSPLILYALNRGAPSFINPAVFGSLSHFSYKSSFVFLPRGKCILDDNGTPLNLNLWDPHSWTRLCSPEVRNAHPDFPTYITQVLQSSSTFLASLSHNPSTSYPRFATISGSSWPTVTQYKSSQDANGMIRITRPAGFEGGDTVVTEMSARMPAGYDWQNVESVYPHPFLMNDLRAVVLAFEAVNAQSTQ